MLRYKSYVIIFHSTSKMRFERHARTRFISSKSTLVNFQQGWKNKPQVAMKLPDFCLTPLKSICFQSCCIHRQIHPLGCWDPRAWSVYQFKRPTYACAKNEATLCFCRFDLSAANNLSNRTPHHSTHSLQNPIPTAFSRQNFSNFFIFASL